jgi:hypothetical protein
MRDFLFNLAGLVVIGLVLFLLFPDITKGILQLYNGLGILPIFVLTVIVAALPRRRRRRR